MALLAVAAVLSLMVAIPISALVPLPIWSHIAWTIAALSLERSPFTWRHGDGIESRLWRRHWFR
jgi:hypothetical protein